ncbi:hypothetical protein CEXT_84201 [Caerostris extrusa]|uniref:Uncharacterized protein n=1 Tax=Caerostris extrusa TaxID=172846 RepID=A0AAV4Y8D1_CAEEX|nr:hypothetical protein CEXT_84201 [Caerostris extrusa]
MISVAWTLYMLGLYSEVQAKVHEELTGYFGEDVDRHATLDDLKDMKYLITTWLLLSILVYNLTTLTDLVNSFTTCLQVVIALAERLFEVTSLRSTDPTGSASSCSLNDALGSSQTLRPPPKSLMGGYSECSRLSNETSNTVSYLRASDGAQS